MAQFSNEHFSWLDRCRAVKDITIEALGRAGLVLGDLWGYPFAPCIEPRGPQVVTESITTDPQELLDFSTPFYLPVALAVMRKFNEELNSESYVQQILQEWSQE